MIDEKRELKECTFRPEINENSYKLTSAQEDRDCFEQLYAQAKTSSKLREEKWKEREAERNTQSIQECTFQPTIEALHTDIPINDKKIEERALEYVIEKRKRIEENEKAKTDHIDEECTFQPMKRPRRVIEENVEKQINVQAIDKYLERMSNAKEKKEMIEKGWNEKIGSGKHWKDQMTIPEAPKLVGRPKPNKRPKALNKPVSMMESVNSKHNNSTGSFKTHQNYPKSTKAQEFESCKSKAKLLLQKKNEKNRELLKIDEKMDYGQAQWAIHSHILALDV